MKKAYEEKISAPNYERSHLYYQYTVDHIQFEELQERLKNLIHVFVAIHQTNIHYLC